MNWKYEGKEILSIDDMPENAFGFIYLINNLTKDKFYIGKKQILSKRKKKLTKKEISGDKRKKDWKYVIKESDWMKYCSSSKELIEDIKNGDEVEKHILQFCFSKIELTYQEVRYQLIENVIHPDVNSYNSNILGKFYPSIFENT